VYFDPNQERQCHYNEEHHPRGGVQCQTSSWGQWITHTAGLLYAVVNEWRAIIIIFSILAIVFILILNYSSVLKVKWRINGKIKDLILPCMYDDFNLQEEFLTPVKTTLKKKVSLASVKSYLVIDSFVYMDKFILKC
jgi:hypothetical protein